MATVLSQKMGEMELRREIEIKFKVGHKKVKTFKEILAKFFELRNQAGEFLLSMKSGNEITTEQYKLFGWQDCLKWVIDLEDETEKEELKQNNHDDNIA
jgi:hypothetical protein